MLARAPIRLRLTLWYVLLLALILAAFAAGVYLLLRHSLYQNIDESIQNQANALMNVIQYEGERPLLPIQADLENQNQDEYFARGFDSSGSLSFDNSSDLGEVPIDAEAVAAALGGQSTTRRVQVVGDDDTMRVKTLPIIRSGTIVGVLQVGQSEDDVSETLAKLLLIMAIAYPVTLAVAGFGGIFLAGRALSPIDNIARAARQISAEGLDQRLNMGLPNDEVRRLARTFDEMIARLDDAFRRLRQFTTDASHELRTPLTIIKGQVDVALQNERESNPESTDGQGWTA